MGAIQRQAVSVGPSHPVRSHSAAGDAQAGPRTIVALSAIPSRRVQPY